MGNKYLDQALISKDIKYKYARTQRLYLKLIREQNYERARWDFKEYIKLIFNADKPQKEKEEYVFEFFHEILIKELIDFLFGEETNKLMFLLPPRAGKSELGSILIPTWIYGVMAYRVLLAGKKISYDIIQSSYSDTLLKKFIAKQVDYVSSESWKAIFPNVRLAKKIYGVQFSRTATNLDFVADVFKRGFRETGGDYKKACSVWTVPLGGAVTGMGANLIILDDMVKGISEADSIRVKDNTWNWWLSTLSTRLEDRDGMKGKILSLNTRWSEDDLTARLEEEGDWKVIRFPAEAYPEGHELRDFRDPRKVKEPLSKRLANRFAEQKKSMSQRHFSSLYQQISVPLEGNIIKGSDIMLYQQKPEKIDILVMGIDLAYKGSKPEVEKAAKKELSYSVFETWGYQAFNDRFYLLDQRRGRYRFSEQEAILLEFVKANPSLRTVYLEDAANAQALYDRLQNQILNFELWKPKTDKGIRLRLVEHLYKKKQVYYPDPEIWSWSRENIEEITKFPAHKFRDTVDVASMVLLHLKEYSEDNLALSTLGTW